MRPKPPCRGELGFEAQLASIQLLGVVKVLDFFPPIGINDDEFIAVAHLSGAGFAAYEFALTLKEENHMRTLTPARTVVCGVIAAVTAYSAVSAGVVRAQQAASFDAAVERLLNDYIGLYRRDTLDQWKTLFLPGFVATYTNDDGSVTTRSLDEFYDRQRNAFTQGEVSETLHNVRVQRAGRLAHVFADFRFTSRGTMRPGQLMLLMIEERGQLRIAALTFTYHLTSEGR